jgi:hypothetical protein
MTLSAQQQQACQAVRVQRENTPLIPITLQQQQACQAVRVQRENTPLIPITLLDSTIP